MKGGSGGSGAGVIDLRSDTVTLPTPAMRQAMYAAEVGDDVYGDDPTVLRLQETAAAMLGKEAGLFVTAGTQGNLVSILAQVARGEEILVGDSSHVQVNEAGGASVLGGVVIAPLPAAADGGFEPQQVTAAVKGSDYHQPRTRLLCLENTHNASSGRASDRSPHSASWPRPAMPLGLRVHLDGARLFNAAVACGVSAAELAAEVDSVTFCLSKGLACPVGSVVCGKRAFIAEATRWRKMLGSGMRQVGVLAAPGLVALETMIDRLADDHANARRLAYGLAEIDGLELDPAAIETNIVRFGVPAGSGFEIADRLRAAGVLINPGQSDLRMVTHYGIAADDVDATLQAMRQVMAAVMAARHRAHPGVAAAAADEQPA